MDLRAGAPLLCGQAETVRVIQPGEEKTLGGCYCTFQYIKGSVRKLERDLLVGPVMAG